MSYHALYRQYRPSRFCEVVGQEHITDVLRNQIRTGRIAHAYLFSGSRGTGKTSTARILARAVNCLDPKDGEPCGKCAACLTDVSESIDIIEMDAASNSKVDEMRALLEKAEFAPIYLKTKVYIIDEAHMLSKSANNALLKTLEEPPAHVVFILATTEPQALPATILSRCQRFDFRRLSVHNLAANTRRVLRSAGAEIEDEALMCIARAADGGMRDCLSIADQCLSFCGNADSTEQKLITQQDVLSVLGSMNADFLFDFADSVLHSDTAAVMKNIEQVVSGGRDIGVFVQDLSNHFRSLLLAKVCGSCADILDCTQDTMERYLAQAESAGKARLERTLDALMQLQPNLRWVTMPRVLLESTLLKVCHPDEQTEMAALIDRMEELERRLKSGAFVSAEPKAASDSAQSSGSRSDNSNNSGNKEAGSASSKTEKAAAEPALPTPHVVSDSFEVPAATPEAEELFRAFMAALMKTDMMLGIQIQLAAAHWLENENLFICFDKSKRSNYNYANTPEVKAKLRRAAGESIAPHGVELVLKDGSVVAKKDVPTELFGVEITEV